MSTLRRNKVWKKTWLNEMYYAVNTTGKKIGKCFLALVKSNKRTFTELQTMSIIVMKINFSQSYLILHIYIY